MTLNIVMQYYADLSFNANFRQSFRRFGDGYLRQRIFNPDYCSALLFDNYSI